MPHIIVDFADVDPVSGRIDFLMDDIVALAKTSAAIEPANLKLRAVPFRHFRVNDGGAPFIHIAIRMMHGPARNDLDDLLDAIHRTAGERFPEVRQITVHLVLVDPENYRKIQA